MNKIYLILLLTAVSFGQSKPQNNIDTSKVNDRVPKPTVLAKVDTIRIKNLTTTPSVIPIDKENDTRVVIVKDVSVEDYSKYIISLLSLIAGFFLNRLFDWWNNKRKIKSSGQRWIIELITIQPSIIEQIKIIESTVKDIEKFNWEKSLFSLLPNLNGEIFKSLDKNDFYKYIRRKQRSKILKWKFYETKKDSIEIDAETVIISNIVQGFIFVYVNHYNLLFDSWKDYQLKLIKSDELLSICFQNIERQMTIIDNKIVSDGVIYKAENIAAIITYYNLYRLKIKEDLEYNPINLLDDFVKPLSDMINPYLDNEHFSELDARLGALHYVLQSVKVDMSSMNDIFKQVIERYKFTLERLPDVLSKVENEEVITKIENKEPKI